MESIAEIITWGLGATYPTGLLYELSVSPEDFSNEGHVEIVELKCW